MITKAILSKLFAVCLIILGIIQIFIANRQITTSLKTYNYDNSLTKLIQENIELENKIAAESALSEIEKKAVKLGFLTSGNYLFLNKSLPLALNHP